MPSRLNSIKEVIFSFFSNLTIDKSLSTEEVPGKTVSKPPEKVGKDWNRKWKFSHASVSPHCNQISPWKPSDEAQRRMQFEAICSGLQLIQSLLCWKKLKAVPDDSVPNTRNIVSKPLPTDAVIQQESPSSTKRFWNLYRWPQHGFTKLEPWISTQLASKDLWHHCQWDIRFCPNQTNPCIRWNHEQGKVLRKSCSSRT